MGQKTRADIVNEGMLLAGRDDIADRANIWLQTWLDSVANSWPWPMNVREKLTIPVASGSQTVTVGNGSGGITQKVLRIFNNIWVKTSDYRNRNQVFIKQLLSRPDSLEDPTRNAGLPSECRVTQPSGFGSFVLEFDRVPPEAYLLTLDYLELPDALVDDDSVPWYPNDWTMIQLIAARTMFYDNGPDSAYQAALGEVADLLKADRMRYGSSPGINDLIQLDPGVYK